MSKLIIANWKMNLPSDLSYFSQKMRDDVGIVICPPFTHIEKIKNLLSPGIKLGAQDVFWENRGAYTGEISPMMLNDLGVEYVIIGHSERRRHLGETDEMINKKVRAAKEAGLKVILCVGESLAIRKKGKKAIEDFIENQLRKDLEDLFAAGQEATDDLIIAYEPIWAIGTGIPDTPRDAAETIGFIKKMLKANSYKLTAILYGGSVNSENAASFLSQDSIGGLLVGDASLNADEFAKIIQSA